MLGLGLKRFNTSHHFLWNYREVAAGLGRGGDLVRDDSNVCDRDGGVRPGFGIGGLRLRDPDGNGVRLYRRGVKQHGRFGRSVFLRWRGAAGGRVQEGARVGEGRQGRLGSSHARRNVGEFRLDFDGHWVGRLPMGGTWSAPSARWRTWGCGSGTGPARRCPLLGRTPLTPGKDTRNPAFSQDHVQWVRVYHGHLWLNTNTQTDLNLITIKILPYTVIFIPDHESSQNPNSMTSFLSKWLLSL